MNKTEKPSNQLIFYTVYTFIRKHEGADGTGLNEFYLGRIEAAKKLLESGIRDLESRASDNEPSNLKGISSEIVQALCGKTRGMSREDRRKYAARISGYVQELRDLKASPMEFYKDDHSELKEALQNMSGEYVWDNNAGKCYQNP